MTKIYMVRHGQASAGWDGGRDPGLSRLGHEQAEASANDLAPSGPLQILSSPMARARETARPLCRLWQAEAKIDPRFAEIPSPDLGLSERSTWLYKVMQDRWPNLESSLQAWRQTMIETVRDITEDTVIFSHFIAINVFTGAALKDDSVVIFYPDNGSITILEVLNKKIRLVEKGKEARTIIR